MDVDVDEEEHAISLMPDWARRNLAGQSRNFRHKIDFVRLQGGDSLPLAELTIQAKDSSHVK